MLVANKIDQFGDRMVTVEDGQRRYREIDCIGFREISVRESIEQVKKNLQVFLTFPIHKVVLYIGKHKFTVCGPLLLFRNDYFGFKYHFLHA